MYRARVSLLCHKDVALFSFRRFAKEGDRGDDREPPSPMNIGASAEVFRHQTLHDIRQREIVETSRRLSSGNKFAGPATDSASYRLSASLSARMKRGEAAQTNIHHALSFIRTQADALRTVEHVLTRMDDLAYQAADITYTDADRSRLNMEFREMQAHLEGMLGEEQFGQAMFDPYAAKYEERYPVLGISDGGWEEQRQAVDIGAHRGTVHMWWNPTWQTDALRLYHGNNLVFDSGEYRSQHWNNFDDIDNPMMSGGYDYFSIDFGAEDANSTASPDNAGISFHDKDIKDDLRSTTTKKELNWYQEQGHDPEKFITAEDYPLSQPSLADSSELTFVVNEERGGFPYPRNDASTTVWYYYAEIEKSSLSGVTTMVNSDGYEFELYAKGFSSLSELTITDRTHAAHSLKVIEEERQNLGYQLGVVGGEMARFEAQADLLDEKNFVESRALDRLSGIDMASELTHLARAQILNEATRHSLVHSRLSAERVFDLLT